MKLNIKKSALIGLAVSSLAMSSTLLHAVDFPEKGDFIAGAKAWADNCTRCHNLRDPKELRDDQWLTTMFHMRVRGGLTGQETRDILTFLQQSN
ncbi:MAG: cytochrome c [Gammaproteobacteria bacterium]|nr:cytochrome c [Gammaproteobacteria bacterium]